MKKVIVVINLICCVQLSAQSYETKGVDSYDREIAYNVAQLQYDTGVMQSKLANKWGIATTVLSGISLLVCHHG